MPAPSKRTMTMFCGPPIMAKICKGHLEKLGYDVDNQHFEF